MKIIGKKAVSFLLALIICVSLLPLSVFAENLTTLAFEVETVSAVTGSSAKVKINIKHNPGISSVKLLVEYDESLTLASVEYNNEMGGQFMQPSNMSSPATLVWLNPFGEFKGDATFATLTFTTPANVSDSYEAPITLNYNEEDIYNLNEDNVSCRVISGGVRIFAGVPGDINGDGVLNNKDLTRLFQYMANWDVEVNQAALDTNGDGSVNNKDLTRLFQYLADWDVELFYGSTIGHKHLSKFIEEKKATCVDAGNISYYYCEECSGFFTDAACKNEVSQIDVTIEPKGHTVVIDEAVSATTTSTGKTEGSHCSKCLITLVEQEEIPKLEQDQYPIKYELSNNDLYLASVDIENPNDNLYISESGVDFLKEPKVDGYKFLGWFRDSVDNSRRVTSIPKGTTGEYVIYAHWERIEYWVYFDSPLVPVEEKPYYVDTGATLINPVLDGYIFTGWCNDDNELVTAVPKGTIGNITLHANWTSKRNQTRPVTKLEDPIILEDEENGIILFTYEIGTIENIPLLQLHENVYQNTSGIQQSFMTVEEASVSKTTAEGIANTISSSTINSSSWSLSKEWNDSVSVSEEYANQQGWSQSEADSYSRTKNNTYSLNSTSGGSTTTTNSAGISGTLHSDTSKTATGTLNSERETGSEFEVNGKLKSELSANVGIDEVVSLGGKKSFEIGGSYKNYEKNKTGVSLSYSKTGTQGTSLTTDTSSINSGTSTWNTSSGYSASDTVGSSSTISNVLSGVINETKGYGSTYAFGGSNSSNCGIEKSDTESNEYTSNVSYNKASSKTNTQSIVLGGEIEGFYRFVLAGTAHVFAVVGYDVSTRSYFISTYSVMDDNTYTFIDFSKNTANFNDYENGVLPFEVPIFVKNYVDFKTGDTEGLKIDTQTGIIDEYVGTAKTVHIPAYMRVNDIDGNGNPGSVKVTGISENAFKNNSSIEAVSLANTITLIPSDAFLNCTSLKVVKAPGVTSIGENAFSGCLSLTGFTVPSEITSLGTNAFNGVSDVKISASSVNVAKNASSCCAKGFVLNVSAISDELRGVTLDIPSSVDYFEIQGGNRTFIDFKIESDAKTTYINGIVFNNSSGTPISSSSENITLNGVYASSTGFCLIINANATVSLHQTNSLHSDTGKTILCKNLTLKETESNGTGKLYVSGNIYAKNKSITDNKLLTIDNGETKEITDDEFDKYFNGVYSLSFNTNGGSLASTTYKEIEVGKPIGTLPEPVRSNYLFNGWYTAVDGGNIIDENTIFTDYSDMVIYAHWSKNSYVASWSEGLGTTITVNRTSTTNNDASIGTISSGDKVYYGDVLSVSYKAKTGYTLSTNGKTSITVNGNITSSDIYATAKLNSYTASWSAGTGTTISVNRTDSPYGGAATGSLSSGAKVYYGDVLSVTYSAKTGYTLATKGSASITVKGNITSSNIYATATAKSYTYNIVYKSSNGTDLGTSTVTKSYGTTNTISAPAKTGYTTPSSQTVKWDSTSAKTITFKYTPATVNKSQAITNKKWKNGVTYSFWFEYRNRTSTTIDVRVTYSATVDPGYTANYNLIGAVSTYYGTNNSKHIYCDYTMPTSQFNTTSGVERSVGGSSAWTTISVSAKTNTLYFQTSCWTDPETVVQTDEATLKIPTY